MRNEDLHRLHDGELPAEAGGARPALDEGDRARLRALDDLGAAVRNTLEAEAAEIDVWAGVERRLAQPSVVSIGRRLRRSARFTVPAFLAAAAALIIYLGVGRGGPSNACDVELLDIAGASATVLRIPDSTGTTTVIWTTED